MKLAGYIWALRSLGVYFNTEELSHLQKQKHLDLLKNSSGF